MARKIDLERTLTLCLGGFWILDGILQLQPAMFTAAFVHEVLAPSLLGQPSFIVSIIAFGMRVFGSNIFWWNFASVIIQLAIGALLLLPSRPASHRFGLWLSVVWAMIIWIFAEGLGGIMTGAASFYMGAPGAALFYAIIAVALLFSFEKKLPRIAGILFLIGAALQLAPMFFEPGMLSMLTVVPWATAPFTALGAQGTLFGNFIAIDVLALLGIFLLTIPNRAAGWTASIFLLFIWWFSQGFGEILTFPHGTATDPGSAPILILFLIPIFFLRETSRTAGA